MTASYDFEIERGSTVPPVQFRLPLDGAGSEWRLKLRFPDDQFLALSTEAGTLTAENVIVDGVTKTLLTWPRTLEQSRQIPLGKVTAYELEQIEPSGGQRVWLDGYISGVGGLNDDV